MQRVTDIIGKPIIVGETGEKLGTVADVLVDPAGAQVIGLVVGGGIFGAEHVLPYAHVTTWGGDAVITRGGTEMIKAKDWHDRGVSVIRSSELKNRRVMSDAGRQVGAVKDLFVNERSGAVEAYEIAGAAFAGLIERTATLPRPDSLAIGPDAMVVPEAAAEALDRHE